MTGIFSMSYKYCLPEWRPALDKRPPASRTLSKSPVFYVLLLNLVFKSTSKKISFYASFHISCPWHCTLVSKKNLIEMFTKFSIPILTPPSWFPPPWKLGRHIEVLHQKLLIWFSLRSPPAHKWLSLTKNKWAELFIFDRAALNNYPAYESCAE